MTNEEILLAECVTRGITEEVHTFAKWKQLGYRVKKGEHALFSTSLWKQCNSKQKENDENTEEVVAVSGRCYLCKSYLFGRSQVEEVTDVQNPV